MKLLFLCKRSPMGRDLVYRPYGRFYYLPKCLAERGHQVHHLLLNYRCEGSLDMHRHGIHWMSESLLSGNPARYLQRLKSVIQEVRPDWIIGLSDTYFGILAQHYGHRYGIRSCIDAYDNYESYIPWMVPLHKLWRRALSRADLVTAAGPDLAMYLSSQRADNPAMIVPMAADPVGFMPLDRTDCRRRMGLPLSGQFVGYCGSLHSTRGVETLFEAIDILRNTQPDVELLVSGRKWKNVPVPASARFLGYIDDDKMPLLLNCMNSLSVINRLTPFGRYSHPVKLYEAMNCQIPVVVTQTPATQWILREHPEFLVPPSDPEQLCARLAQSTALERVKYRNLTDWQTCCDALEQALLDSR